MSFDTPKYLVKNVLSGPGKGRSAARAFLCLAVLLFTFLQDGPQWLVTAEAREKDRDREGMFRWSPALKGDSCAVQKVKTGTETVVEVEAVTGNNVREVAFVIPPYFRNFGIRVEPPASEVREGIARARVVFRVSSGMPLGRHDLPVEVFEKNSRTVIVSGSIPFILLPGDLECLC